MNKITAWLSENRLAASLGAAFLLCAGIGGWLTIGAWDDYATASQTHADAVAKLANLTRQNPFPSEANKTKLQSNINQEQADLNALTKALQGFRVTPFGNLEKAKPQDRPQLFQDSVRAAVTAVRDTAASKGVTLPPGFYLGMEEYENRLPSPEEVMPLASQVTVLDWIAAQLASQGGLILSEFARVQPSTAPKSASASKKTLPSAEPETKGAQTSIGCLRTAFRCDQASLREFLNAISSGPYFLLIESFQLQNTVTEPPRRDSAPQSSQQAPPPDPSQQGQSPVQRLPIIVGREQINVSMKLRFLEFNGSQQLQGTNGKAK